MVWIPKTDKVKLDVGPLDFSRKHRRKCRQNSIPEILTRRQCLSKVAEVFNITGMIITAAMKMELHLLVQRKVNRDDSIPDDLHHVWLSHFETIKELPLLKFRRAIIPRDAISLELDTIECGDSSNEMACLAIYARFLRQCQSCQLIFSLAS